MNTTNNTFSITAFLTNANSCRTYLSIKRHGADNTKPDAMVVMMNPGSANNKLKEHEGENSLQADATIRKIQHVMNNCDFNYVRIVNLSDLRQPKSQTFYNLIKSHKATDTIDNLLRSSIFHPSREKDFKEIFVQDVPLIIAWGIEPVLNDFIQLSIEQLNGCREIYGLRKENSNAFYHPLRRTKTKSALFNKWEDDISAQIKDRQTISFA